MQSGLDFTAPSLPGKGPFFCGETVRSPQDTGTLDVSCAPHPTEVVLVWTERGGPPVKAPSNQGGFGSKLINRAVATQLGGTISRDWIAEGVVVALTVQKDRLSR